MAITASKTALFTMEGGLYLPSEHTRGPWDPGSLHGGAPGALLTRCFEQHLEGNDLTFGRLGFEFLRPIPMAPLEVTITVARPGRRVRELHANLASGGEQIGRADALLVRPVGEDVPVPDSSLERMAPKEDALGAFPELRDRRRTPRGPPAGGHGLRIDGHGGEVARPAVVRRPGPRMGEAEDGPAPRRADVAARAGRRCR